MELGAAEELDREHVRLDRELADEEATERLRLGRPPDLALGSLRLGIEARDRRLIHDALDAALRDAGQRRGLGQAVSCSTQDLDLGLLTISIGCGSSGTVEKALGQLGTVMSGVAELLHAAHNAGITSRVPPPPAPQPPPPPPVESYEDDDREEEDDQDDDQPEEAAPKSGIPEVVQLLIKETVDKVVPLIFEKITEKIASGSGLGGLPLEAIFDWRKAVPNPGATQSAPAAAPSAPAAPVAQSAPVSTAPSVPPAPSAPTPAPASMPRSPASTGYPHAVTPPPTPSAPAPAGAAPNPPSPLGAAPAETAALPGASSPQTQEEAAALINAHILKVWQGLSPPERARATQLIAHLTPDERTAWLADLTSRTVPDAIARARAVIHAQPPAPATPQLPTATPQGDPS